MVPNGEDFPPNSFVCFPEDAILALMNHSGLIPH